MKLFQWIVMISHNSGSFYGCLCPGKYLTGIVNESGIGYRPLFGSENPVLYPRSSAAFQAKELRRVGYHVRAVPYVLVMIFARLKARKNSVWKR